MTATETKQPSRTGRKSPYAGKKISRTTDIKKGEFPAINALKSAKQKALFNCILGAIGSKKAIPVEEVLGKSVTYVRASKAGESTETAKVTSADISAIVEGGFASVA